MGFLGGLKKAFTAPLKPINKAVGAIPGINKIQAATPGLKPVGGALGIGPSPQVPQQAAPPPMPAPQLEPMQPPPDMAPPMDQSMDQPMQSEPIQQAPPPQMANWGQKLNPQISQGADVGQMGRVAQTMGQVFGNQGMKPGMGQGMGIGPQPNKLQGMLQKRQMNVNPQMRGRMQQMGRSMGPMGQ